MKERLRKSSITYLSVQYHSYLAYCYNFVAARIMECRFEQPDRGIIDCGHPLIYISQPPRCGGTMLRNLFDGHPKCHVVPHELSWEKNGYHWNAFLDEFKTSSKIYKLLFDKWIDHAIVNGIDKKYPFSFNRRTQKKLFSIKDQHKCMTDARYWLNQYLTSFFNAWYDYHGIYEDDKKYCVAFCPWTFIKHKRIQRYFNIYPDGYRIQLIRDPFSWWASEKRYDGTLKKLEDHLESHWINPVRDGLLLQKKYPTRYLLVSFNDIIRSPLYSMKTICNVMGLPFNENLLIPTINGRKRISNTSFGNGKIGIDTSVLSKWKDYLTKMEILEIGTIAEELYNDALVSCLNFFGR